MVTLGDSSALALDDVVVHIGPNCHMVQYALRRGEFFNQVAVFRSPRASAGETDWGTPDELDSAFAGTTPRVQAGLAHRWRDRWWRMYDRVPIGRWVDRRLALVGDAAHPMLQYLAQGACQGLEDADCLATLVAAETGLHDVEWDAVLSSYNERRTTRTAEVQRIAREWGDLWHCNGLLRSVRNTVLRNPCSHGLPACGLALRSGSPGCPCRKGCVDSGVESVP